MSVSANSQLDMVRDFHFHHGSLLVDNALDRKDDLVDVLAVDFFAVLESLHHVVDEVLGHFVLETHAVVVGLYNHGIEIKSLGRGGLITNLDGGEEGELAHNLLAFLQLESSILVVRIQSDTFFEVIECLLGLENGGSREATSIVRLDISAARPESQHLIIVPNEKRDYWTNKP